MPNKRNITGECFGRLTVLSPSENKRGRTHWLCQCSCGKTVVVQTSHLLLGHTKSCGCWKYELSCNRAKIDLMGQQIGRWFVIRQEDIHGQGTFWLCRCDCGIEKVVDGQSLRQGVSKSCGCLHDEVSSQRAIQRIISTNFGASESCVLFLNGIEQQFGVVLERKFVLGNRVFDARIGNVLIEVDGEFWHSRYENVMNDATKNRIAARHGFTLVRCIVNQKSEVNNKLIFYQDRLCRVLTCKEAV